MNEDDSSSSTTDVYHSDNEDDDSRYMNNSESDVYNDDLDITGPVLQVDTNTSNTDSDDANHAVGLVDVNNNDQEREAAHDTMPLDPAEYNKQLGLQLDNTTLPMTTQTHLQQTHRPSSNQSTQDNQHTESPHLYQVGQT